MTTHKILIQYKTEFAQFLKSFVVWEHTANYTILKNVGFLLFCLFNKTDIIELLYTDQNFYSIYTYFNSLSEM